jgi:predicted ATP-grasp superfamily ATP-dependent carboligase
MTTQQGAAPVAPTIDRSVLPGVLILGGAHNALALARSFGRKGVPVMQVSNDHPLPTYSRYVRRSFPWPGAAAPGAAAWLAAFGEQHGLQRWLLLPCADHEVRLVAENHDVLGAGFQILGKPWQDIQSLCNKQLLVQAAEATGISVPKSYSLESATDAASIDITFPVILKPAMRMSRNALTSAKAWRADTREELVTLYRRAAAIQGQDGVVVQDYIPGGGEAQFSYAALWSNNAPLAEMAARRTRQYPVEFGYTSTFVEIVDNVEIKAMSRKLLSSSGFEGLIEVEYKYDARTASYRILDVNPRAWSWLALCEAGGFDLAALIGGILSAHPETASQAALGHAWVHASRDIAASIHLILLDRLTFGKWLASYRQKLTFAVFAWDDPKPALLELPVTLVRVAKRKLAAKRQALKARFTRTFRKTGTNLL